MSGAGSSEERDCSGGHAMTGLMKSAIANDLASIKHALDSSTIHGQLDSIAAKGSTARHGAYECNEYTDIFLVRCSTDALRPEQLELEAGEVEGVKLVPAKEVISAWEANDPAYVPRTPEYGAVIRQGLSKVGF